MLRIIIDVLIAVGAFFALAGTLGVLKMPDTFSRMQASTCITTLGMLGVAIGGLPLDETLLADEGISAGFRRKAERGFLRYPQGKIIARQGRGMPRPRLCGNASLPGKPLYGFPLRGKLSPQVTDEGASAGSFPLIRRAGAPPSPKGGRLSLNNPPHKNKHTIATKIQKLHKM